MELQHLIFEEKEGIATITLNNPKLLNALNRALLEELGGLCQKLNTDHTIGAVILTGNEAAFAAGADVNEVARLSSPVEVRELQSSTAAASTDAV